MSSRSPTRRAMCFVWRSTTARLDGGRIVRMGQLQHVRGGAQRRERIAQLVAQHREEFVLRAARFPEGLFHLLALGDVHAHRPRAAPRRRIAHHLPRLSTQRTAPSAHTMRYSRYCSSRSYPSSPSARAQLVRMDLLLVGLERPREGGRLQAVDRLHLARPRKALRAEIQFPALPSPGVGATCSRSSRSRIASTDRCAARKPRDHRSAHARHGQTLAAPDGVRRLGERRDRRLRAA